MVFSSLFFLYRFFPLNIIFYYISKNSTWRNWVLIVFSLFFYSWGEPVWVLLLICTCFINYLLAFLIERLRHGHGSKAALCAALIVNLGFLAFFKYGGFFVSNINSLMGLKLSMPVFSLPIGISFYTFQIISYIIDVYRGEVKAQKSFSKLLLYVSLFHQLVAGPIVRYSTIESEIENRTVAASDFSEGMTMFCIGLFKKVAVANIIGSLVGQLMGVPAASATVGGAWVGAVLYGLQIYYDFSAYSDMALGMGRMFGFHYLQNFNYPYSAASVSDFWRRWHISLASFFRDYLYIPLGGNRKHQYFNLFVVWFCTGLWHGASWNFIIWGLYFGVFIALERLFLGRLLQKLKVLPHLYLLFVVIVGWVIFYFTDMSQLKEYLMLMFGFTSAPFWSLEVSLLVTNNLFWIIAAMIFCMPIIPIFRVFFNLQFGKRPAFIYLQIPLCIAALLISTALLVGQSYNPFLYFRF